MKKTEKEAVFTETMDVATHRFPVDRGDVFSGLEQVTIDGHDVTSVTFHYIVASDDAAAYSAMKERDSQLSMKDLERRRTDKASKLPAVWERMPSPGANR